MRCLINLSIRAGCYLAKEAPFGGSCSGGDIARFFVPGEPGEKSECGGFDRLRVPAIIRTGMDLRFRFIFAQRGSNSSEEIRVSRASARENDFIRKGGEVKVIIESDRAGRQLDERREHVGFAYVPL